jgi:uncharacterized protein (TIGR03083 family)
VGAAGEAVVEAWDRLIVLAERIGPDDWQRPTPCPDADVAGLVSHVAGPSAWLRPPPAGADSLVAGLRTARAAQVSHIAAPSGATGQQIQLTRGERALRASCADLWVHGYDLTTGLGEDVDLDDSSATLAQACAYLLAITPQLVASRVGGDATAGLRVALHGAIEHDGVLTVRDGRGRWSADGTAGARHQVSGTPAAFLLLLSGRGDPHDLRDRGALEWSGTHGEAFVRQARLLSA